MKISNLIVSSLVVGGLVFGFSGCGGSTKNLTKPEKIEKYSDMSENEQLEAVKERGSNIQYIKNPSKKVQLEAVKRDGYAIKYLNNPSEEVQLEAAKEDGNAIRHLNNPSEEVQLEAVKQSGYVIEYIKNESEEIKLIAYGKIDINNKPTSYILNSKSLGITITNNNSYKIHNHTNKFLKISNISSYYGENIMSQQNISVPPEGIKTLTFLNPAITVKSLDEKVNFGFAVEYTLSGSNKVENLYETKNYLVKDLIK